MVIIKFMKKYILKEVIISNDNDVEFNEYNNIVICSDKNVVRSMGVLVYSIIKNTKTKCAFHIFFNGNMPTGDIEKFTYLSQKYSVPIVIYYINNFYFKNFNSTSTITETAYYRLIAPNILRVKNINKCIYFDTDMLCLNDISIFNEFDIRDKIAFVVEDYGFMINKNKNYWKILGLKSNQYFNSGFLIINIEKYIKNNIAEKAIELLKKNSYPHMDQDVLNILLDEEVIVSKNFKYNLVTSVPDEYNTDDVVVVHFTGTRKPWKEYTSFWGESISHTKRQNYYARWRHYWLKSSWKEVPLDKPKIATDWRYLAEMYYLDKDIVNCIKAYSKYLFLKFSK